MVSCVACCCYLAVKFNLSVQKLDVEKQIEYKLSKENGLECSFEHGIFIINYGAMKISYFLFNSMAL